MRVIVIGAGVVGAAVAAGLARRGAEVTVLEAERPGAGTTGNTFAWVNAGGKEPESYFALNHAGMRAHRELAGGNAPWYFPTGNLVVAGEEHRAALANRLDRLRDRDYPAQRLTPARVRELEPDLVLPPGAAYAFFPDEAHVLPISLLARLLGDARDHGATVHTRAAVTEVDGGVASTADGTRHRADVVVSCTGRWTTEVASLAGAAIPMIDPNRAGTPAVGYLATTAPVPVRLTRVLHTPALNVRPDGAGRLQLHAPDLDPGADPANPGTDVAAEFARRLPEVLTGTENAPIDAVRIGQRAIPGDGHTVAGFTDPGFYVVATHSGVTLAPLLGDLVADELFGVESPMLADFRPDRFPGSDPRH
ncbi:NAD(P)/FAD-dependent oxidoreductase [Actinophytocola sp.]|uniref:NAD(P)/FAD-dependent oxidoreductase n=1 Tax=Actinophytocola sp. TaxID=1872138 RepID=UPI0038999EF8